jgi:TolA-binding protein
VFNIGKSTKTRGCGKVNIRNTNIKVENLNELKELLQKATDQLEQLEQTMKHIESFDLKVIVN